eukprot:jgi/Bigna1/136794/aug1.36_g11502
MMLAYSRSTYSERLVRGYSVVHHDLEIISNGGYSVVHHDLEIISNGRFISDGMGWQRQQREREKHLTCPFLMELPRTLNELDGMMTKTTSNSNSMATSTSDHDVSESEYSEYLEEKSLITSKEQIADRSGLSDYAKRMSKLKESFQTLAFPKIKVVSAKKKKKKGHMLLLSPSKTTFTIEVTCNCLSWKVERKKADIVYLYEQCMEISREELDDAKNLLEALRKKNLVQVRCRGLELLLTTLCGKETFMTSSPLQTFLGFKSADSSLQEILKEEGDPLFSDEAPLPHWIHSCVKTLATNTKNRVFFLKALLPTYGEDVPIGVLTVRIISATNVPKLDILSESDPYVRLFIGADDSKEKGRNTRTIMNCPNPVWNESFTFKIVNATSSLRIQLWDHDTISADELIGTSSIPLVSLPNGIKVIFLYLMLMRTTAWGFFMKLISFFVHVLTSHKQRHINQEGKRIPSILKANRHSHEVLANKYATNQWFGKIRENRCIKEIF